MDSANSPQSIKYGGGPRRNDPSGHWGSVGRRFKSCRGEIKCKEIIPVFLNNRSAQSVNQSLTIQLIISNTRNAAVVQVAVYAANNQIIDGQASDFALIIAADGLLTVKNLKVLNFDFVAQINQLINEVNQLQSTVGTIDSDIVGVKNGIIAIQQELTRQQHFRGYYLLNTDIQTLPDSADGDYAFSAESGTVWMYSDNWYNSGDIVPDQVTPASDTVLLVDSGAGVAGINTEYARGDHQHPLQVSEQIPSRDTGTGAAGTSTAYSRADHQHILNTDPTVANLPQKDTGTGNNGNLDYYARSNHAHPLNVDPTVANVPLVNATATANGTSDFYSRNDHVHPQQLTYDGNITATKFIKTGGLAAEVLCANGDTINGVVDLASNQTITGIKTFDSIKKTNGTNNEILIADGTTKKVVLAQHNYYVSTTEKYIKLCQFIPYNQSNNVSVAFYINCRQAAYILYYGSGTTGYGELCEGLRIANTTNNLCLISLGCDPNTTSGYIDKQWSIYKKGDGTLNIVRTADQNTSGKGLQISADGNTLSFNGSVIAGVGATNGASSGSVQYSAGNPILWGVNSVGTEGGFYSNGTNICWRARPITLGSVPP
ncbi:MAG: hypothetical protein EZS28_002943 [Streblomastix strix]|uniref:Tail fiber protein n=1 Tax=Streblomastix strix TaxID=222440 RepID=A0A5J4X2Q8_9EUKA|nr:MAG: hypothetical protein EZS28_002941 [Streblomastix strix]KAA6401533.1 MAG: hypothetical protein EZS28_002943 [Streblomastix strix]